MSASQFKRYIWLVDTIRSAGRISRQDIDRRWAKSTFNERGESRLPERTFFRYKDAIEELFDIEIACDRSSGGLYYIKSDTDGSRTRQYLLSQFALSNSLQESRQLNGRILYEQIPAGTQYLTVIVEAMRRNQWLQVSHRRFDSTDERTFRLAPYCLKVFKQRWYVLGKDSEHNDVRIYALDRVTALQITEKTFSLPRQFDAESYFEGYYGVFRGKQFRPELIRVRVSPEAAPFLRSLPLHTSQQEPEPCLFTWYVAPTFDFVQQLRTFGSNLEVLAPESLRDEFAEETMRLARIY